LKGTAAWAYRAHDLYSLGQVDEGLLSAEQAVELDPNNHRGFRARAVGHGLKKRYEEMLQDATTALELDPTQHLAHRLRGKALTHLGRLDEALAEYALEPDQNNVKGLIADIYKEYQRVIRLDVCKDDSLDYLKLRASDPAASSAWMHEEEIKADRKQTSGKLPDARPPTYGKDYRVWWSVQEGKAPSVS
jgi:tetratricopeptide (TPR) repeat protein